MAGDLNVTFRKKGNEEWVVSVGLRQLHNPELPTFKKAAPPDAMVITPGTYFPEGPLLIDVVGKGGRTH